MTEREMIQNEIHRIIGAHQAALEGLRSAFGAMYRAFEAHDAALVGAIEANRAALELLDLFVNRRDE